MLSLCSWLKFVSNGQWISGYQKGGGKIKKLNVKKKMVTTQILHIILINIVYILFLEI